MEKLTKREEALMQLFWQHGPLFVQEIVAMMPEPKPHFNTISTQVRTLEAKGYLGHEVLGARLGNRPLFRLLLPGCRLGAG